MADDARQTPSDLSNPGGDMDFFQLLSLIEKGDARFGRSGGPEREPARLGQSPRLSFAASDVANVTMPRDDETAPHACTLLARMGRRTTCGAGGTRRG